MSIDRSPVSQLRMWLRETRRRWYGWLVPVGYGLGMSCMLWAYMKLLKTIEVDASQRVAAYVIASSTLLILGSLVLFLRFTRWGRVAWGKLLGPLSWWYLVNRVGHTVSVYLSNEKLDVQISDRHEFDVRNACDRANPSMDMVDSIQPVLVMDVGGVRGSERTWISVMGHSLSEFLLVVLDDDVFKRPKSGSASRSVKVGLFDPRDQGISDSDESEAEPVLVSVHVLLERLYSVFGAMFKDAVQAPEDVSPEEHFKNVIESFLRGRAFLDVLMDSDLSASGVRDALQYVRHGVDRIEEMLGCRLDSSRGFTLQAFMRSMVGIVEEGHKRELEFLSRVIETLLHMSDAIDSNQRDTAVMLLSVEVPQLLRSWLRLAEQLGVSEREVHQKRMLLTRFTDSVDGVDDTENGEIEIGDADIDGSSALSLDDSVDDGATSPLGRGVGEKTLPPVPSLPVPPLPVPTPAASRARFFGADSPLLSGIRARVQEEGPDLDGLLDGDELLDDSDEGATTRS